MDWPTVASLATALGTLVLAAATFAAVRSANRAARAAERSLLAGLRPLLMPARPQDPDQKVMWQDQHFAHVRGGRAVIEEVGDVIYLAASLRNAGNGIAVLHGWYPQVGWSPAPQTHEPPDQFRRLVRDLYIPAGDIGFWQGAIREPDDPFRAELTSAMAASDRIAIDVLYGDHEGGQRTIVRLALTPVADGYLCTSGRYWNVDQNDPR
jgi:hypothetical protein